MEQGTLHDEQELLEQFQQLVSSVERKHLNGPFVKPSLQRKFEDHGYHLLKNHFYSPVPAISEATVGGDDDPVFADALGLTDLHALDAHFFKLLSHSAELKTLPRSSDSGFYWNNPMFPPLDAAIYFGVLREIKPQRVIEIGCGFSTEIAFLAARALPNLSIECIEPFPSERFKLLIPRLAKYSQQKIQDVPLDYFAGLNRGDILFIDTTHVVKHNSDINHIVFHILPRLKPGVVVHIHDIFLPFEYPSRWLSEIGIMWNEQYLILALLMGGSRYKSKVLNYYFSKRHEERLKAIFKDFDIWNLTENLGGARGASFWFEVSQTKCGGFCGLLNRLRLVLPFY